MAASGCLSLFLLLGFTTRSHLKRFGRHDYRMLVPRARKGLRAYLVMTLVRGRYDDLEASVTVDPWLMAPLRAGEKIGSLTVSLDGAVLHEGPLVVVEDVPEAGFFLRIWHSLYLFFAKLFS